MTQETFFSRQPEWERCQRLVSGLEKLRDGGSSLMHAHLPIDVLQMVFHRLLGDMATRSNGFVTQPMQNQIDDLFFSSISVAKLYQRTTRPSASRCGKTSDVEPTVHAIGSAATILKIKRLTSFARDSRRRSCEEGHPDGRRRLWPNSSIPQSSCRNIPGFGG